MADEAWANDTDGGNSEAAAAAPSTTKAPQPAAAAPSASGGPPAASAAPSSTSGAHSVLTSDSATLSSLDIVSTLVSDLRAGRLHAASDTLSKILHLDIDDPFDTDLGRRSIVDSYLELVEHFALLLNYSDKQVQQLLILQNDLLNELSLQSLPSALSGESWSARGGNSAALGAGPSSGAAGGSGSTPLKQQPQINAVAASQSGAAALPSAASSAPSPLSAITRSFTIKLQKLCTRRPVTVDEKIVVTEHVAEEVPDPVALAQLEQQVAAAASKKGKAGAKGPTTVDPASVPKITVHRQVTHETVVRHDIEIDPSFSLREMQAIVRYFTDTIFAHWRLFHYVLTTREQETRVKNVTLAFEDLPQGLPPLAAAVTAAEHARIQQQRQLWDDAVSAFEEEFSESERDMSVLEPVYLKATAAAWAAHNERVAEDLANAMSFDEYQRATAVLTTALAAGSKRTDLTALKRLERLEGAMPVIAPAPAAQAATAAAGRPTAPKK